MPAPHKNTSRAAERRRQRRQRRMDEGGVPQRPTATPRLAPVSMETRRRPATSTLQAVQMLDPATEYRFVRRDLWRLTIYSVICFVLMIVVLFVLEG
jgi:hypothetical protein